ncbi:MAG: hypothetical protein KDA85_16160, partial [Planctomycetaceae bacterium]|nr:hypothetical protein [Planctomycetaceae bacterium]
MHPGQRIPCVVSAWLVLTLPCLGQQQGTLSEELSGLVHPRFCAAIIVRPGQIYQSDVGKSLQIPALIRFAAQQFAVDPDAIATLCDPRKIDQLTILVDPLPGGNVAFLSGVVVEFNEDVDSRTLVRAVWPDSSPSLDDPRLLRHLEEMAGTEIQALIPGPRMLVIAPAPTLELMQAPQKSVQNPLRNRVRREADSSDIVIVYESSPTLAAVQELTGFSERELRADPETDDAVKFLSLDIESITLKVDLQKSPVVKVGIECVRTSIASQLETTISDALLNLQIALSTSDSRRMLRDELEGELPPQLLDLMDSFALREAVEAIQVRKHGRTVDVSVEIPPLMVKMAVDAVEDLVGEEPDAADEPQWYVVFRSSDPAIWNKDVREAPDRFAVPLSRAPAGIRYVRVKRMDNDDYVIT